MKTVLKGVELEVKKEEVEEVAKSGQVKGKGKTRYMVIVEGSRLPAKRLISEVLKKKGINLTLQDFSTKDAVHILRKLGFEIVDMEEEKRKSLLDLAGMIAIGGNAVEDKRNLYSS